MRYLYISGDAFDLKDFACRYPMTRTPSVPKKASETVLLRVENLDGFQTAKWLSDGLLHVDDPELRLGQLRPVPIAFMNGRWVRMPELLVENCESLVGMSVRIYSAGASQGITFRENMGWMTKKQVEAYYRKHHKYP